MITADLIILEPAPINIDPGPCQLCGRTIDEHFRIDTFEGSIFLCENGADDLVCQWELADPRDRWKHTGEPPPTAAVRNSDISARPADKPQPYRTPQATVDAFWFVVSLCDPERLKSWLSDHPQDEPFLLKLLKGK
jgi:hypothetical protein